LRTLRSGVAVCTIDPIQTWSSRDTLETKEEHKKASTSKSTEHQKERNTLLSTLFACLLAQWEDSGHKIEYHF
jgi:hypothetical protein